jgi:hypothetical protein
MSKAPRLSSPSHKATAISVCRWVTAIGLALALSGCVPPQRRSADWPTEPARVPPPRPAPPPPTPAPAPPAPVPPPAPAPPRPACAPGVSVIGTLAVITNAVFRNRVTASSGERVCNGDHISTNATGVGDLLLDGDRASDSIHFSENTDPSITLTPNGCVTVDAYTTGRVVATARRRCMVLRTPDTLLLLVGGSAQVHVRSTTTEVVPLRGTLIKLISFPPQKVNLMSQTQLSQIAASTNLQPQLQSLNIYSRSKLTRPAVRLPPSQIQQIERSVIRRPAVPVTPPDQQIR